MRQQWSRVGNAFSSSSRYADAHAFVHQAQPGAGSDRPPAASGRTAFSLGLMNPVVFFRIALLLPLVLPLALLPFGMNSVVGVLALSLAFGGAQYVVFASVLFLWIGRVKDTERIRRLSYVAPLLFIPVQAAGWVIYGYVEKLSNPELVGTWEPLIAFAVYILLIGYAYVGAVNLLYLVIFRRAARAIEPWRWFGPSACGVRPHSFHVGPDERVAKEMM